MGDSYLNEFDWEMERRGVKMVRYADDIVLFAKSMRAAKRLLETASRYLEQRLKPVVNKEKSHATSVYSKRFKFLSLMLGKNGEGIFIRVHKSALRKCKQRLKVLTRQTGAETSGRS